ncbi:hypothetical protein JHJ32_21510 [Parapedobacter sp. ISTM3]|uniref:hypothetical protein n=1 Tax=Parapedobacter sp. ISTM3 TaxID=2800130 RepID=UPI001905DDAE|nr:hypothetical protein [Parapedobacter sp. ISTM3]MBK1442592.1 hypothetical protein [Parapedobacter sp. ISTM3]
METEIDNVNNKAVGQSAAGKPTVYDRIREGLAVASQLIIASPLSLPAKVVAVAKYVTLALGILDAVERAGKSDGSAEK